MEVHPPEGSVGSWRGFLLHIATVTVGILIALGLEQVTVWYHHRAIVNEAEANIRNELGDNKKALEASLPAMKKSVSDEEAALTIVTDLLAHKKLGQRSLTIGFSGPSLNSTSWRAAEAVGALSYMEYPRLKKYSGLYDTQSEYLRLQEHALDVTMNAITLFHSDPDKLSDRDLDDSRKQLLASIATGRIQQQVAKQLIEQYGKTLGERK